MRLLDRAISTLLPYTPRAVVRYVARPYIAGESVEDAMNVVAQLNHAGAVCTVDALGEFVRSPEIAARETEESLQVLNEIDRRNLASGLSVKLTSLGLEISRDFCRDNLLRVLERAAELDSFVRIDMENSRHTDATLQLAREMWERFPGHVGVVLQAYLRRTLSDIRDLAPTGISFRLCKGIYREPEKIAYQDREEIRENFLAATEAILEAGCYIGLATHDEYLIEQAKKIVERRELTRDQYEFQMLLGVRESLRDELIVGGHRMRVYVPFGSDWYGYSVRRLKENPAIAGHVFKAFFRVGK